VGLGSAIYTGIFLLRSDSAPGKIVRIEPRTNAEDGSVNYLPVFIFTASDGRTYTVASGVASDPPEFEEGQDVRVLYLKSDPQSARIGTFLQLWFVTLVCSALGVFFSLMGFLLFRWERRRARRKSLMAVSV
jgi:hypothetical protein